MASRNQGAKYCGEDGIQFEYNGRSYHAVVPGSPKILYNCFAYEELNDVGYGWSWNPIHLIMLPVSLAQRYYYNIYDDAPLHYIQLTQLNVGGSEDVLQHQNALRKAVEKDVLERGRQLVLFGCSRGAATTFTSAATCSNDLIQHVRLVILEAPFDSLQNVVEKTSWFPSLTLPLLRNFTKYDDTQLSPLDAAEQFPLHVPVAFVTSELDDRVPRECTQHIVDRLRERGHQHVHTLELRHSGHSVMPISNDEDQIAYLKFVNSLYEKYIT